MSHVTGRVRAAGWGIAPAGHLLDLPGFRPAYFGPVRDGFANDPEAFDADPADLADLADMHAAGGEALEG
ncbi:hypothetical protein ACFWWT_43155 [Streptomyces sp. NPDC058676]|uniref:hypothetical protein n=1 Tax=unclassified Streptomyces TaxID=2593676 RepID=UPI00364BD858